MEINELKLTWWTAYIYFYDNFSVTMFGVMRGSKISFNKKIEFLSNFENYSWVYIKYDGTASL